MGIESKKIEKVFSPVILWVFLLALSASMAMYAYLGTYSRYWADDYCEAASTRSLSPLGAVLQRYTNNTWSADARPSMRYSNLLLVGISEFLGEKSVQITAPVMILLWTAGLAWSAHEVRKQLKIVWPIQADGLIGLVLAFFSLYQAPNLFQSIYWRTAMMTHFAPLVFASFLFAFLVRQSSRPISVLSYPAAFLSAYLISGFSEPPATTLVTASALGIAGSFLRRSSRPQSGIMGLLFTVLAGGVFGILTMLLSPAIASVVVDSPPSLVNVFLNSFSYAYVFMADSVAVQPLSMLVLTAISFLSFWLYARRSGFPQFPIQRWSASLACMLVIPVLAWLLIAAGFSPSVYGQGYPVERMRFLAEFLVIVTVVLEGVLLGWLLANTKWKSPPFLSAVAMALLALLVMVYPVRAAVRLFQEELPAYQKRAQAWDRRDAHIYVLRDSGQTDLIVPQFSGFNGIKELDNLTTHWVNRCAASYYGVNSISAVTLHGPEALEEYYNNSGE